MWSTSLKSKIGYNCLRTYLNWFVDVTIIPHIPQIFCCIVRQKFDFCCQLSYSQNVSQDRNKGLALSNQFPHLEVYQDFKTDRYSLVPWPQPTWCDPGQDGWGSDQDACLLCEWKKGYWCQSWPRRDSAHLSPKQTQVTINIWYFYVSRIKIVLVSRPLPLFVR